MCIWKAWKKVKTKVVNLIKCGINKYQAYEFVFLLLDYLYINTNHALIIRKLLLLLHNKMKSLFNNYTHFII